MRAELEWVEADAADPLADKAGVLACRRELAIAVATGERERAGLPAGQSEILVDGLPRLLGEFELGRLASSGGLSLDRAYSRLGLVIDPHGHDITATQFAVDGEIEQREIVDAPLKL
jgi:hypothetical protein